MVPYVDRERLTLVPSPGHQKSAQRQTVRLSWIDREENLGRIMSLGRNSRRQRARLPFATTNGTQLAVTIALPSTVSFMV